MRAFGLEFDSVAIEAIVAEVEARYPNEACGIVLGKAGAVELGRVVPLKNVQDKFHKVDPSRFPRTARDAFRLDDLQRMRMLDVAETEGLSERIMFHSHCDAAAYFSAEDRAMAVQDDIELMPGVVFVVASVIDAKCVDMAAYIYQDGRFVERRLPLSEGIFSVNRDPTVRTARSQSGLIRSLLDPEEFEAWVETADAQTAVDDPTFWVAVAAAVHGSYSPMKVWASSLPHGDWASQNSAQRVHLVHSAGLYEAIAVGGRVFACPQRVPTVVDPLDHRAEILRQGALRIEAVVKGNPSGQPKTMMLRLGTDAGADIRVHSLDSEWVTTAARNHGATHLLWNEESEL